MRVYARWDEELDPESDQEIYSGLALWHLSQVSDDEIACELSDLLVENDIRRFIEFKLDYGQLSAGDSAHIRQAQAFFSKREDLDLGYDKSATALKKFWEAEEACRLTNECFKKRAKGEFQLFPFVERVLWHASRKISSILGDIPALEDLRFRFGPGATTQIPKRMASARAKLGTDPACSSELRATAHSVLMSVPAWESNLWETNGGSYDGEIPVIIHPGKISLVPKSAKEYRSIMVEPSLNTFCQAGVGSYIAERLRNCGVDIRDQTLNQRLARKGSIDGSLATVDLSSASDTISIELVYDLLGVDWGAFLSRFRTGTVDFEGKLVRLEKFSSMGNGFTFPLETLIFYALAWGVCVEIGAATGDVISYGDDIIIPSEAYPSLLRVFTSCGFTVNTEKSFAKGPFRESCGKDYHQGIDIRPLYQKTRPCVYDLFRLHNFYFRRYEFDVCAHLLSYIDPSIRLFGPDGHADVGRAPSKRLRLWKRDEIFYEGHLLGEWVPRRKPSHASAGYAGFLFDTFTFRSRRSHLGYKGDWVLPAYTIYLSEGLEDRSQLHGSDVVYTGNSFSVGVPGVQSVNRISIYTMSG